MSTDIPPPEQSEEPGIVCPKCLLVNDPGAAFCVDCGTPIGAVANLEPMQHIFSEGYGYRSAVEGPPSRIVLIGIWLLFTLPAASCVLFLFSGGADRVQDWLFVGMVSVPSIVILYRTTHNYLLKSRAAKISADESQSEPDQDSP